MPANADYLLPGEALWAGQSITSPNGRFTLIYQHDANLVLYKNFWDRPRAWIWDSETNGHPTHVCAFQGDGNLVIYGPDGEAIWDSGTWVQPQGKRLSIRDDGTVVITQWAGYNRWIRGFLQGGMSPMGPRASGDDMAMGESIHPGDRLHSANGEYTLHFQADRNVVLTWNANGGQRLWATNTAGSGAESLILRRDGSLGLFRGDGHLLWSSNTYTYGAPVRLQVQNDGNLVMSRLDGTRVWQSQTASQPLPQGPSAHGTNAIRPGQVLRPGESLHSTNRAFTLHYQPQDGNLVLFRHRRDAPAHSIWATNTVFAPAGVVAVHADGQFAVYDVRGRVAWTSPYRSPVPNGLVLQDDGNLVLFYNGTSVLWSSGTVQPCPPYGPTATGHDMAAGEILYPGRRLVSQNGVFTLDFHVDRGPVLHRQVSNSTPIRLWALEELYGRGNDQLMLHADGNLAVYRADGGLLWHSGTAGRGGSRLVLQDDGDLVLCRVDGTPVWRTGTGRTLPTGPAAQGDRILPGQTLAPGAEIHSPDGRYTLTYQADGNLVLYKNIRNADRAALWASGTVGWRPGVVHAAADGNLRILNQFVDLQWETGVSAGAPEGLILQDDGNFVFYGDGEPLWATDTVQASDPGDLVERFAPEVRLHPDDEYRPSSVEWFLPRTELRMDGDLRLGVGQVNPESLTSQTWELQKSGGGYPTDFYLTTPHSSSHAGHLPGATCYARVIEREGGGKDIQYWFFYPYNGDLVLDSTIGIGALLLLLNPILGPFLAAAAVVDRVEHEADWEHVTVRLNADDQVERVYFSAHHGEGDWYDADQVLFNEHGRPIVYSALNSHASYPVPGDNHREGALQVFVPDYTADGGPVWRTWERLERLRTEDDAEMQPWLRYGGFWGEPGSMPFGLNKGPRGPMFQESWHGDRETEDQVLLKGWMVFREDNGGNGDVVGRTTDAPGQVIRIPHRTDWTNDEAQTLQLYGVRGGTIITVYNDTDGDTDEGHSRITVKNDIDGMVLVGTFEADYEDDCFKVEVLHDGELDGKVSRVTVQRTDDMWLPSFAGGGGGGTSGDPDRPPVHQNALPETDPEAGTTTDGIIPEAEMALA